MSIRNFPKLPKIILIKSADQAKDEKNPFSKLAIQISQDLTYFCVALPLTFRRFWTFPPFAIIGLCPYSPTRASCCSKIEESILSLWNCEVNVIFVINYSLTFVQTSHFIRSHRNETKVLCSFVCRITYGA